jgi:hypothetical protein
MWLYELLAAVTGQELRTVHSQNPNTAPVERSITHRFG